MTFNAAIYFREFPPGILKNSCSGKSEVLKILQRKQNYFCKYILKEKPRYIGKPNVKINHIKWMSQNKMVDDTYNNDDNINSPKFRVGIFGTVSQ